MRLPYVQTGIPRAIAVSLGRGQRHVPVQGLRVQRRTSGGGAVLVGPWLLRALVVLPRSHAWVADGPARAAQFLGAAHREWSAGLGIAVEPYEGPLVDHWSCFAGRAPGELMHDGRKITGIAQTWRRRRVLLWSGTLIEPAPWILLANALGQPTCGVTALAEGAVSARELLGVAPQPLAWSLALRAALARATGSG